MASRDFRALTAQYEDWSTERLVSAVALERAEFRPQALELMEAVLDRRGVSAARRARIARSLAQQSAVRRRSGLRGVMLRAVSPDQPTQGPRVMYRRDFIMITIAPGLFWGLVALWDVVLRWPLAGAESTLVFVHAVLLGSCVVVPGAVMAMRKRTGRFVAGLVGAIIGWTVGVLVLIVVGFLVTILTPRSNDGVNLAVGAVAGWFLGVLVVSPLAGLSTLLAGTVIDRARAKSEYRRPV